MILSDAMGADTKRLRLPPGPRGSLLLGSYLAYRKTDLLTFAQRCYNEFGDIAHVRLGPQHLIFLANPLDVSYVLKNQAVYDKTRSQQYVKLISGDSLNTLSFYGDWKEKVALLSKSIRQVPPAVHANIIDQSLDELVARWTPFIGTKEVVNVSADMLQLSISIVVRMLLGVEPDFLNTAAIDFHKYRIVRHIISRSLNPVNLPIALSKELRESIQYRDEVVAALLDRFLAARPNADSYLGRLVQKYGILSARSTAAKKAQGEILSALYLGSDPSDKLLAWSFYYMSMYPAEKEKLRSEIEAMTGGQPITFAQAARLESFRMFLCEVLRLKTPYVVIARDVLADDEIRGYAIPRGSICVILPLLVHMHPDYWENPAAFKPERFKAAQASRGPAFIPFSDGARQCTGRSIVLHHSMYILARLLQRFEFSLLPTYDYSNKFLGTLGSREGIRVCLEATPRQSQTDAVVN